MAIKGNRQFCGTVCLALLYTYQVGQMNHPLSDSKVRNVNKENWETKRNRFIRRDGEITKKKKVLRKRLKRRKRI